MKRIFLFPLLFICIIITSIASSCASNKKCMCPKGFHSEAPYKRNQV
ncbi:MAG: hypothetical protein WCP57_06915 [Bacteroidota bacterium]